MSRARAPPWCPVIAAGAPSREPADRERAELGVALDFSSHYFPSLLRSLLVILLPCGGSTVRAGPSARRWAVGSACTLALVLGRVPGPGGGRRGVTLKLWHDRDG